jgi:hypothetical protein
MHSVKYNRCFYLSTVSVYIYCRVKKQPISPGFLEEVIHELDRYSPGRLQRKHTSYTEKNMREIPVREKAWLVLDL